MSKARSLIEEMPDDEGRRLAEFNLDGTNVGGSPWQGWTNSATWAFHLLFFQEPDLVNEFCAQRAAGALDVERVAKLFDHAQREGRMEAIDDDTEGMVNVPEIIAAEKGNEGAAVRENQGKLHWKQVGDQPVVSKGGSYETADGRLIYWHGSEGVDAEVELAKKAKQPRMPDGKPIRGIRGSGGPTVRAQRQGTNEAADAGLVSYHITGDHPTREIPPQDREQHQRIFQVGFQRGAEALLVNVYSDTCDESDAEEAALEFLQQRAPQSLKPEEANGAEGASFVRKLAEARVRPVEPVGPRPEGSTKRRAKPEAQAEEKQEADVVLPAGDAETTVEVSGTAAEVQKSLRKLASKKTGKVQEMGGALPPTRDDLDAFTRAYIQAILFAENDQSDEQGGDPLDRNYDIEDFAPETLKAIVADCKKFQAENAEAINVGTSRGSGEYSSEEQAGHDFWFTRVGHGVGFWDGDWPEPQATQLTDASHKFGEVWIYVGDDGLIYQSSSEKPRGPGIEGVSVVDEDPPPDPNAPTFQSVRPGDEEKDKDEEDEEGEGWKEEASKSVVDRILEEEEDDEGRLDDEPDPEGDLRRQAHDEMKLDLESGECAIIQGRASGPDEVYFIGKRLGLIGDNAEFASIESALKAIRREAERFGFYPNIYSINERGSVTQLDLKGREINSWV